MTQLSPLLLIAGVYLAVLASPGPNFFILSQMALDGRQRESRALGNTRPFNVVQRSRKH